MVDYLEKLKKELEIIQDEDKSYSPTEAREIYRERRDKGKGFDYYYANANHLTQKEKIQASAEAYHEIKKGLTQKNVNLVERGAELYHIVGRPKQAVSKLIYAIKYMDNLDKGRRDYLIFSANRILKEADARKSNLEKKVTVFLGLLAGGAGLAMVSTRFTGNVISSSAQSSSNLIGVLLLVLGLVGAFFYFRKK